MTAPRVYNVEVGRVEILITQADHPIYRWSCDQCEAGDTVGTANALRIARRAAVEHTAATGDGTEVVRMAEWVEVEKP